MFQLWRRERPAEALPGEAGDTGEGDGEVCIEAEVEIARLWLREWDMLGDEERHVSREVYM